LNLPGEALRFHRRMQLRVVGFRCAMQLDAHCEISHSYSFPIFVIRTLSALIVEDIERSRVPIPATRLNEPHALLTVRADHIRRAAVVIEYGIVQRAIAAQRHLAVRARCDHMSPRLQPATL
jgi:hypothetical protein